MKYFVFALFCLSGCAHENKYFPLYLESRTVCRERSVGDEKVTTCVTDTPNYDRKPYAPSIIPPRPKC
jgi:hypothetical protein